MLYGGSGRSGHELLIVALHHKSPSLDDAMPNRPYRKKDSAFARPVRNALLCDGNEIVDAPFLCEEPEPQESPFRIGLISLTLLRIRCSLPSVPV